MRATKFLPLVVALGLLLTTSVSRAESGWVSGTWTMWQRNGHFCPAYRSSTGCRYVQAQFDTGMPLEQAVVAIYHPAFTNPIGLGRTFSDGWFNVQWSVTGTLPNKHLAQVYVVPEQYQGRFRFYSPSGGRYPIWVGPFTIVAGTTQAAPQSIGYPFIGNNAASANALYNAYWAATLAWKYTLGTSGQMYANFTNVEVRGFSNTTTGFFSSPSPVVCPSSCSLWSEKKIQLDENAQFKPQNRTIHEMGHVASGQSEAWNLTKNCYSKDGDFAWSLVSKEYGCSLMEEALSSFVADSTLYAHNAVDPHTCEGSQAQACSTDYGSGVSTTNIELSRGAGAAECGIPTAWNSLDLWPGEWEQTKSGIRFFWDIYDSANDGEAFSEGAAGSWWRILRNLDSYPQGPGGDTTVVNGINEFWNSSFTAFDNADGRGTLGYTNNFNSSYGVNFSAIRSQNCSPP